MDVIDLKDTKKLASIVTKSVRRSVFKTMTVNRRGRKIGCIRTSFGCIISFEEYGSPIEDDSQSQEI